MLQKPKTNQTFVSIKRVHPKLPNIKDMVTPFMTEAIDEKMLEEQALSRIKEDSYILNNSNRYPENKTNMSPDNFFRYQDPKPVSHDEIVEVETSVLQVSKRHQ
jgi:hypothetical protein